MSVVPDISPSFKDGRSGGSRETIRISIVFPGTMSDHEIEGLEIPNSSGPDGRCGPSSGSGTVVTCGLSALETVCPPSRREKCGYPPLLPGILFLQPHISFLLVGAFGMHRPPDARPHSHPVGLEQSQFPGQMHLFATEKG